MTHEELIENCKAVAMDLYSNDMEYSYQILDQIITILEQNVEERG